MKRLSVLLLLISVMLAGLLAACGESTPASSDTTAASTEPTEPEYGGILTIMHEPIPPVIGWPVEMAAGPGGAAVQGILEFLLHANADGEIYGWLAESYEVAEDKMSITFNLRQGVKFHDGSDFNAEVVKWNLDQWIEAKSQPAWESVEIVDDYTVKVNLKKWETNVLLTFVENIAPVQMISKEAFDKNGLEWVKSNPVGTGPFVFERFVPDVELVTTKNPDYWVEGRPYLDGITAKFVKDPVTINLAMQAGEADMAGSPLRQLPEYEAGGFEIKSFREAIWVLIPDTANPNSPWAKKEVREAVEYAIDKQAIADALGYDYIEAPYSIAPATSLAYDTDLVPRREYDLPKAKQLLAAAGYENGFDTTIYVFPPSDMDYIVAVQDQLKALGINAALETMDFGRWFTYMRQGSWPENGCLISPIPRFDVSFLGGIAFTFRTFGQSWERPPALVQAFEEANSTLEIDVDKVRAFVEVVNEDALLIPVFEGARTSVFQPGVHVPLNERGYLLYWDYEETWIEQ